MSRRRTSPVADFLTAFNQAYNTTNQVVQDFEIAKIAKAKPEESQGFTQDQGDQLRAAAESGQYDIGIETDEQGGFKGYTVTPKADPSQTGVIAKQGVTDFMGQRTAGSMSADQVNSARQRAMAGVIMRDDPVRGTAMMRDITRDERDTERYGWEKSRNERQIRLDQDADADKALLQDIDAKAGDWFKSRLTNPDGSQRAATVDDHLAASEFRAVQLMAAGKTEAAGKVISEHSAQSLIKIQLETATRNEALGKAAAALAAGDLEPVKDFYNRFTPDGAQVTNVSRDAKGQIVVERTTDDGRPLPPTTLADTGQLLAALNTFKDPMALYNWSQNEFRNNLQIKADQRADRADARAGAQFAQGQADRAQTREEAEAKATAAVNLYRENNPNATPAQLEAVRRGVIDAVPKADGSAPADVKLAQAALTAGVPGVTDMASALQWARGKSETTPQEMHREFVNAALKNMAKPEDAVADADAVMKTMGFVKQGNRWTSPSSPQAGGGSLAAGAAAQGLPKVNTPEELAKLPKGSRYVAPDGSVRIRQ